MITVANIRDKGVKAAIKAGDPAFVWCARANRFDRLPKSKWANPFVIGKDGTREEVIAKYRDYITSQPDLMAALPELLDKTLVCWCKTPFDYETSEDDMKDMPLDDYVQWMLENGYYDVSVETGAVTNPRSGEVLHAFVNSRGYLSVNLVFNREVVRRVTVHRMIAIKVYGCEAVQGKQIAHLDGNKLHNSAQNLKPMVTREHVEYDGTDRNLTYRTEPKSDWSPCARCADPDGPVQGHNKTPDRISGERFGIEGQICRRCYGALQERERRRIAREKHAAETACHCDVLKELAEGTMSE